MADGSGSSSASSDAVMISLEAHTEKPILQYTWNNQETYVPEQTPAQRAFQIVERLDFGQLESGLLDEEDDFRHPETVDTAALAWTNLFDTLSEATQEVNGLFDVLSVVRKTDYITIGSVKASKPTVNPAARLVAFHQQYAEAGSYLRNCAERIKRSTAAEQAFFQELGVAAAHWPLRQSGRAILAFFGYHGSSIREDVFAEIRQRSPSSASEASPSPFELVIPVQYRARSDIQVALCHPTGWEAALAAMPAIADPPPDTWHDMLLVARDSVLNHEVMAVLQAEVYADSGASARTVSDNAVLIHVTRDVSILVRHTQGPLRGGAGAAVSAEAGPEAMDASADASMAVFSDSPFTQDLAALLRTTLLRCVRDRHKRRLMVDRTRFKVLLRSKPELPPVPSLLAATATLARHLFAQRDIDRAIKGLQGEIAQSSLGVVCAQQWTTQARPEASSCLVLLSAPSDDNKHSYTLKFDVRTTGDRVDISFSSSHDSKPVILYGEHERVLQTMYKLIRVHFAHFIARVIAVEAQAVGFILTGTVFPLPHSAHPVKVELSRDDCIMRLDAYHVNVKDTEVRAVLERKGRDDLEAFWTRIDGNSPTARFLSLAHSFGLSK